MDLPELQAALRHLADRIGPRAQINVVLLNEADRSTDAYAWIYPNGGAINGTQVCGATWRILLHAIEIKVAEIAGQRTAPDREYESWFAPELPLAAE